jgi:hypothetical protein
MNAEGPFYTTGHRSQSGEWCGDCLWCGAPEHEAPELLAPLDETNINTYFARQPATPDEVARAVMAIQVCCVAALRYGGHDPEIIAALDNDPDCCDYILDDRSGLKCTVGQLVLMPGRTSGALLSDERIEQEVTEITEGC